MAREKPPSGEIATSGERDIAELFVGAQPRQPRDSIPQARGGGDWALYEDLFRDDQVKATFQQRVGAVISREWIVDPGGDSAADRAAADFMREQLDAIRFDDATAKMLSGLFYGFAVGEFIWVRDGRRWMAETVKVRNRRRFRWDRAGNLRLLTRDAPDGEILPPRKFWAFSAGADRDDDPYGLGLAHWLFRPVFFKRQGIRFWMIFLEKFGQPTTVGRYPPGAPPEERDRLLAAAQAVATEAAAVMPDGMMLELLEAGRRGAADHQALHEIMNAAIAKVALSRTMTTDDGSSRAQAEVHAAVRDHVIKSDADPICASFNAGPARWLTDWNFPGARPPRVWRRVEDAPDLKALAERDEILTRMGYRPGPRAIAETHGDGYLDIGLGAGGPGANGAAPGAHPDREPAAFAEIAFAGADPDAIDALAAAMLDDWRPLADPALEPALAQAAAAEAGGGPEGGKLAAFQERPTPMSAGAGADRLAGRLAQGVFAARLQGEAGANPPGDDDAEADDGEN